MEFTREQRQLALKNLSKETKDFLFSEECIESVQQIGKSHGLLLDKLGILEDAIFLVAYGLIPSAKFVGVIQSKLGLSKDEAFKIGDEVNTSVFLKIRIISQQTKGPEANVEEAFSTPEPNRDSILAEIENPTPSVHPITVADAPVSGPAMTREIVTETKETVAHDFIGSKLTETVALPSQKASVTLKTPEVKPKTYSADPYREAIN